MSGDVTAAIETLRETYAAATPGYWEVAAFDSGLSYRELSVSICTAEEGDDIATVEGPSVHVGREGKPPESETADAEFIVASRNLLPILLAEVERLRAEREALHSDETRARLKTAIQGDEWREPGFAWTTTDRIVDRVISVLSAGSEADQ